MSASEGEREESVRVCARINASRRVSASTVTTLQTRTPHSPTHLPISPLTPPLSAHTHVSFTLVPIHTQAHGNTYTLTFTHTHTLTHIHTYLHTHTPLLSPPLPPLSLPPLHSLSLPPLVKWCKGPPAWSWSIPCFNTYRSVPSLSFSARSALSTHTASSSLTHSLTHSLASHTLSLARAHMTSLPIPKRTWGVATIPLWNDCAGAQITQTW